MLRAYYASVSSLPENVDMSGLSEYRRERLARTSDRGHYAQSLGAELLLIGALRRLGPVELPLEIGTEPEGKPFLKNGPYFSLSHTEGLVFCAVSDAPVGADVQVLRPYRAALARRFFTDGECLWLERQKDKDQAFTRLWSLKESCIKLLGGGISGVHLDSFTVSFDESGQAEIKDSGLKLWYTVGEGCVFALCSPSDWAAGELVKLRLDTGGLCKANFNKDEKQ